MHFSHLTSLALLFSPLARSHPGHDPTEEILERRAFKNSVRHASLAHCAEKLQKRGIQTRNLQRRAATLSTARDAQAIVKRDADSVLSESHNQTSTGYDENTSIEKLFSGNSSCLLTPEVTQGPYYVGGEFVRKNITDGQAGVNVILDYQVVDVDTCDPVPNVYVEIWHCNSTGVYSGVVASGNGDSSDEDNINQTFLRGIQKTDSDGVVRFDTLFPGHYSGRTPHIHVMVHTNATELSNHTLGNEVYASHVGQSFFDQDLISAVEEVEPYSSNTQSLTKNSDDSILAEEADTDGVDPLLAYALLGDSVADGLFAWSAFGINTSYSGSVKPASFYYESGGVENPNSGGGGGGPGGPGGSGGPPSGGPGGSSTNTATGSGSNTSSTAVPTTGTSVANRYTIGAVTFSLIGFLLPALWMI